MSKRLLVLLTTIICCAPLAVAQQTGPRHSDAGPADPSKKAASLGITTSKDSNTEDCGCDQKPAGDLLAMVNGVKITIKDAEERIKDKVADLHQQVIEARKREVDLRINTRLLESEAKKRGVSAAKVIDQEIISKAKEPTEAEARAFYDQRKSQIQGEFIAVKQDLIDYLRTQRQRELAAKLADRLRADAEVKVMVDGITAPEAKADRGRIVATVNGDNITAGEVEDSLQTIIFNVQEQVYRLRKQQLDTRINDVLLQQEAQSRKITATALLEAEVGSKVQQPTENEARAFYEENKEKIKADYSLIRPRIFQQLQERRDRSAQLAFADLLRKAATIQIFLTPPEQPVYAINIEDQPAKGKPEAPVTIVEFTDYECPTCAKTQPIIEQLVQEFEDKLRLVVRDFPLEQHPNAFKSAEAAEAAREQGKYWEYAAILFQKHSELSPAKLKEYARQVGLDINQFNAALDSGKFAEKVQRDLQDGVRLGVNSTPAIFVNGRRVTEKTKESLKAAIEGALKEVTNDRTASGKL